MKKLTKNISSWIITATIIASFYLQPFQSVVTQMVRAEGGCTTPTSGMVITQNTILCRGTYNLSNGLRIGANGITLDCDGATLIGPGTNSGSGISNGGGYDNVVVKNCDVQNYRIGIFLEFADFNILTNNTANNNKENGIYLSASSNNTLTSNIVEGNRNFGIEISISSNFNTLSNNIANLNRFGGVWLYYARNNTLASNTASNNSDRGIALTYSHNNTVASNTFSDNGNFGISLLSSSNNTLTENVVKKNSNYGIAFYESSFSPNRIYNNYFDNTTNARDYDDNNFWSTERDCTRTNIIGGPCIGGNFWSDYKGGDLDGDGLGDTLLPYNSNGNIQNGGDIHPLTSIVLSQAFIVKSGILVNGILQDLFYSDNSYVVVEPPLTKRSAIPIEVLIEGISPTATPGELHFNLETSTDHTGADQIIWLFNYQANMWEEVDRRLGTYSDSVVEIVIYNDPERFIESSTKKVRTKVGYVESTAEVSSWQVRIDQSIWKIRP